MTPLRLFAIGFIFVCTTVAWMILGATVTNRSGEANGELRAEVERLWGGEHVQRAPSAVLQQVGDVVRMVDDVDRDGKKIGQHRETTREVIANDPLALDKSDVKVTLDLEHRRKGLLWFPTYAVSYEGHYRFQNAAGVDGAVNVAFPFPSTQGIYDGFVFKVNGKEAPPVTDLSKGAVFRIDDMKPGDVATVDIAYASRGIGTWSYVFGDGVSQVKDFTLALASNVADVDFPSGSMSPSTKSAAGNGAQLTWKFANLVTGQRIAVELPARLNPGPVAARISFFAPVSLLFFFTVMVILGVVKNRNLHPMNYFFLAAGFFAFHLLLAYLVDVVDIFAAFAISAAASVALVVSYLRIVMGHRASWLQAAGAQVVFLVLFSCAFFVEGQTGLSIAVGATLTLFVLMQLTARVKWAEVFGAPPTTSGAPVGLPQPDLTLKPRG